MASNPKFVSLAGSERSIPAAARYVGPVDPNESVEVMFLLRPMAPAPAAGSGRMTREEFAARHGAAPGDVARVVAFARGAGLQVLSMQPARRTVTVTGPASKVFAAVKADVGSYEHENRRFRGRKGTIDLPGDIADAIEGVFGLDNRPAAKPHMRLAGPGQRAAGQRAFTPVELGEIYAFPTGTSGKGQCIALVELGGGFRQADLDTYFKKLGVKSPKVTAVAVDGAGNAPTGQPDGPDGEVMLDIEVAGALAPDATIAAYFATNTDRGFLDAILAAVHDAQLKPSVISISWGGPEANWTAQSLKAFDGAFAAAASMGVTVCCAAGDDGSTDGLADGRLHVDFPASSPHVLACGGTRLLVSNGAPQETTWNDLAEGGGATGGGVSDSFAPPTWQMAAKVPTSANPDHRIGRGVPDVSGNADPATGYAVRVDGQDTVIGGTSAVAPLWAALIARCNEQAGHSLGFVNPALYAHGGDAFHDVVKGSNGSSAYAAGPGWDACTGWGTPIGNRILTDVSAA